MRVFIAGIDGYLGWSLAQYLAERGHMVGGCDNLLRRRCVQEMDSHSVTPIADISHRLDAFREHHGEIDFYFNDLCDTDEVMWMIYEFEPDAIVHFAEIPSAPYSMIDADHAIITHDNNLTGTLNLLFAMRDICPNAHLIKLGTMGEYGTPNLDIPEGVFEVEYRGRKDTLPFPRQAGSWYHQTKVHDTNNVMFACKVWGLRSTDIMQGVVYGTRIDEMGDDERLLTRFDIDECFGTAINRFCASAVVNHPITLFGAGHQKRGFLPLCDSMQCITLAIENPPAAGEYRTFNQFEAVYDLTELAEIVKQTGESMGYKVIVYNYTNPRMESEDHYYNPDHQHLLDLGYKPTLDLEGQVGKMIADLARYSKRIKAVKHTLVPNIRWDGSKEQSKVIK